MFNRNCIGFVASCICFSTLPLFAQDPTIEQQDAAKTAITESNLRSHIRFLADDLLEGRAPGSNGDKLAQKYVQAQFQGLGMKPAGPNGSWFQSVPLVGVKTAPPAKLTFNGDGKKLVLKNRVDYVVTTGKPEATAKIRDAELVFVGFGIEAPEFDWNDFKDVDLTGMVPVIMNNDPAGDPELFAGNRRLYYGRWDYK